MKNLLFAALIVLYMTSYAFCAQLVLGDVSGATVSVGPGLPARSLMSHFQETVNIRDYGATCDGSTNDYAALDTAQLVAQSRGGATIFIPSDCQLNLGGAMTYTVAGNGWTFGANTRIVSGSIEGITDTIDNIAQTFAKASGALGNESNVFISTLFKPTSVAGASYQKNGIYVRTIQNDDSSYISSNGLDDSLRFHDAVGIESQAILLGPVSGRAWAYHGAAAVSSGSDGQLIVGEFEVYNMASFVDKLQNRFGKSGLHIDAMGTSDSNAAIEIGGVAHWKDGIAVEQGSIRQDGHPLIVRRAGGANTNDSVASINYDGSADFNGVTLSQPLVLKAEAATVVEFVAQGVGNGNVSITPLGGNISAANNLGTLLSGSQTMQAQVTCADGVGGQMSWSIIHMIGYVNGTLTNGLGVITTIGTRNAIWKPLINLNRAIRADTIIVNSNSTGISCTADIKILHTAQ